MLSDLPAPGPAEALTTVLPQPNGPDSDRTTVLPQAAGSDYPAEAPDDVYALGAVLWWAVSGVPLAYATATSAGPDPTPLRQAGAPAEFVALVLRLLDPDPAARPAAGAAAEQFAAVQALPLAGRHHGRSRADRAHPGAGPGRADPGLHPGAGADRALPPGAGQPPAHLGDSGGSAGPGGGRSTGRRAAGEPVEQLPGAVAELHRVAHRALDLLAGDPAQRADLGGLDHVDAHPDAHPDHRDADAHPDAGHAHPDADPDHRDADPQPGGPDHGRHDLARPAAAVGLAMTRP